MLDTIIAESPAWVVPTVGGIVATLMLYSYLRLPRTSFGPDARVWNHVRRVLLPPLDRLKRDRDLGYAAYQLDSDEYVGRIHGSLDHVEQELWDAGYVRQPLAALKTLEDGRTEVGSWAYRERPLSRRQTHVMLFAAQDEPAVDVYAHREYSAIHPLVAAKHYRGVDYSSAGGIEYVVGQLWGEMGAEFELSDRALDVLADLPEPDADSIAEE